LCPPIKILTRFSGIRTVFYEVVEEMEDALVGSKTGLDTSLFILVDTLHNDLTQCLEYMKKERRLPGGILTGLVFPDENAIQNKEKI